MTEIDIYEASIVFGLPPFLIRDMVSFDFNGEKLEAKSRSPYVFERKTLELYATHLESSWPEEKRCPPEWVVRFLIWEAGGACALCRQAKANYDIAHVAPWTKTHCHSPKNLVRLCVDCHRSHGDDQKLLQGLKEELLRERALLRAELLYDCVDDVEVGDAIFVSDGFARRAKASSEVELAVGFVQAKVGRHRCSVIRLGLVVGFSGLTSGHWYFLSPVRPGKIAVFDEVMDEYDKLRAKAGPQFWSQRVGRAESSGHLFIQMTHNIGMPGAAGKTGA